MKRLLFVITLIFWAASANAATTSNPHATQKTKDLLNWLEGLKNRPDTRIVSGEVIGHNQKAWTLFYDEVYNKTGKNLGLIGGDCEWNGFRVPLSQYGINFDQWWVDKYIWHWNQGGLVTLHWHSHNPWNDGTVTDITGSGGTAMDQLITPGSAVYDKWMAKLDALATGFQIFQDAGVVILWRPFGEMNGSWFWWGSQNNSASFLAVWQHMYNYFTYTKGLNNLLWVYSPYGGSDGVLDKYPGDSFVDIVGFSYYPTTQTFSTISAYTTLSAKPKVMAMTEYGYKGAGQVDNTNVINSLRNSSPLVSYVMYWNDYSDHPYSMTSGLNASTFMSNSWIIDRSEVWGTLPTNFHREDPLSGKGAFFH